MSNTQYSDLDRLVHLIVDNLGWGDPEDWSNKDFEELSQRIFDKTGKQISVTTLKRLLGRAKLNSQPSISTLDILASFAGSTDWRSFRQSAHPAPFFKKLRFQYLSGVVIAGIIGLFLLLSQSNVPIVEAEEPLSSEAVDQITFDFEKVAIGYPNTVIFKYDIGDIPFDTLQLQQNWDSRKRILLDKPQGLVTTTYYTSGYFDTKLVIDNEVVRRKNLYIPTDGWQGFIGGNVPQIVYLKKGDIRTDKGVSIQDRVLAEMEQHNPVILNLSNLLPNPSLNSKHFDFEAEFRVSHTLEKSLCNNAWLIIMGTKEVLRFQLSTPGCVGDLTFFLSMERISGRDHDLSAFGLDLNQWTTFKASNRANQLVVTINDKEVFQHQLVSDIGQIGGVEFAFEGLGEIRKLVIEDEEVEVDFLQM